MAVQQTRDLQKKEALNPTETERIRMRKVFSPAVDIYETKDGIVLIADVPGSDEKSIDITLENNVLTITAEVEPLEHEGYTVSYAEYDTGDYQRSFTISDAVDQNNIEAAVKNGVLRITLHKTEKTKAKKIAIQAT